MAAGLKWQKGCLYLVGPQRNSEGVINPLYAIRVGVVYQRDMFFLCLFFIFFINYYMSLENLRYPGLSYTNISLYFIFNVIILTFFYRFDYNISLSLLLFNAFSLITICHWKISMLCLYLPHLHSGANNIQRPS